MASGFWDHGRRSDNTLTARIAALQDELKSLRREAREHGADSYDDARDAMAELIEMLRDSIAAGRHDMARRARRAHGMMRENPGTAATAAAVGLVVVGLAATLLLSRSR